MDWLREHSIQLICIAAYLALLAYHAWLGKCRSNSLGDFLIGGRRMGGVLIALSFYATFVSSVTFVGHAGKSFTLGPSWWLTCVVVFTSMVFVAWFVVAPSFTRLAREYDALTIPDFLGRHYRSPALRRLAALVVVVASLAYMVAVYDGAARLLTELLDLDERVVLVSIFVVVTSYTLVGGFHSVVATDAVQGLILFAGGIILPATMIAHLGGLRPLLAAVTQADADALRWTNGPVPLGTMVGLALGVGLKILVEPRQLSRFYGLSSDEQLRRGRWIAPILLFLTYLCMLPVGFLAHAYVSPSQVAEQGVVQTDRVVPFLLGAEGNLLGPLAGAFFLTGMLAAAMSSLDSVLLVAASSVDHDLIAPDRQHEAAMGWTRVWVLILSAAAAGLALFSGRGIVQMSSFSGSMYAACFLPTFVIGLFWKRATAVGALASLLSGFFVTLVWFFAKKSFAAGNFSWLHEVYVGLSVSVPVYLLISRFTTKSDRGV